MPPVNWERRMSLHYAHLVLLGDAEEWLERALARRFKTATGRQAVDERWICDSIVFRRAEAALNVEYCAQGGWA